MRHASVSSAAVPRSELGLLVAAEQRLDRAIEEARAEARQIRDAAELRAATARAELAATLAIECDRVAAAIEAETAEHAARVEVDAAARAAAHEAVRDDALAALADAIAERLVTIATEDAP